MAVTIASPLYTSTDQDILIHTLLAPHASSSFFNTDFEITHGRLFTLFMYSWVWYQRLYLRGQRSDTTKIVLHMNFFESEVVVPRYLVNSVLQMKTGK